jgi:hypothetical protein
MRNHNAQASGLSVAIPLFYLTVGKGLDERVQTRIERSRNMVCVRV